MILFHGAEAHAGLYRLSQYVLERRRRPVLLLSLDAMPSLAIGDTPAGLQVADRFVNLSDIRSVCLDGIQTPPAPPGLDPHDQDYAATEGWATLIALFGYLSDTALVANVPRPRDVIESRFSLLAHLARQGLPVPRMLVTSHPPAARSLPDVTCRTVAPTAAPPRPMVYDDRLDAIRLAPVVFEEVPEGPTHQVTIVGPRIFNTGLPKSIARKARQALHSLGLLMASLTFVDGYVTDVQTHLTPALLDDPAILKAAAELLERPP
ncbi:MAG TPA: hypothetical protein VGO93_28515 [Candidatus Xenobia bacterium]